MSKTYDTYTTGTGQTLRVHTEDQCSGYSCVIHNPTQHHMINWPTHWRYDREIMERICPHGIGHPDPDELSYQMRQDRPDKLFHGCDGCCVYAIFDDSSAV